jgi:hypothetical protein
MSFPADFWRNLAPEPWKPVRAAPAVMPRLAGLPPSEGPATLPSAAPF